MAGELAQGVLVQLGDVLPADVVEQLKAPLTAGLGLLEAHGDQQAISNVRAQVSAVCKALKAGDHETASNLLAEWGALAAAFGIDPASLVGAERGEVGPGKALLDARVASVVGAD